MYILISGKPPFDGANDQEILENVSNANPDYSGPLWNKVSSEGKDLVRKLLCKDVKKRSSAQNALKH